MALTDRSKANGADEHRKGGSSSGCGDAPDAPSGVARTSLIRCLQRFARPEHLGTADAAFLRASRDFLAEHYPADR